MLIYVIVKCKNITISENCMLVVTWQFRYLELELESTKWSIYYCTCTILKILFFRVILLILKQPLYITNIIGLLPPPPSPPSPPPSHRHHHPLITTISSFCHHCYYVILYRDVCRIHQGQPLASPPLCTALILYTMYHRNAPLFIILILYINLNI
jgi:hypothetical protein